MQTGTSQPKVPSKYGKTFKSAMVALAVAALLGILYYFGLIPGLTSQESKTVNKSTLTKDAVNDKTKTAMLPVPNVNNQEFADLSNRPVVNGMIWEWFGNAGLMAANGGPVTMKNSLMDQRELNINLITNNSVSDMKREQLAFVNDYAKGTDYPSQGVAFVTIMGDGAVAYISEMNKKIKKAYGAEYQLTIAGIIGFSLGEDCIMGPEIWKTDPQSMRGCVISAVNGDGDQLVGIRFAGSDNGIPINPDQGTYDKDAINFVSPPDDDFLKAAEQVIAGTTVELKVKDSKGRLSGETVTKVIQGAGTWFPGDRNIVKNTNLIKVTSTSQYPNQMATVVVGCKKWMRSHTKWTVDFLSACLTATNQIKQYNEWFNFACDVAPRVFCAASPEDCAESPEDWKRYAVPNGSKMANTDNVEVSVGGTQMANLMDNKRYLGMTKSGNNYYRSVYDYVSGILRTLNPAGFMDNVKDITPYEEMVDLTFLEKVNVESAPVKKVEYNKPVESSKSERSWNIQFASGKTTITAQGQESLKELYDLLNIAENSRVEIIGHTDDQGNDDDNLDLSKRRALAVKEWLIKYSNNSFPPERFTVDGKGESEPLVPGKSEDARRQNRRVVIILRTLK